MILLSGCQSLVVSVLVLLPLLLLLVLLPLVQELELVQELVLLPLLLLLVLLDFGFDSMAAVLNWSNVLPVMPVLVSLVVFAVVFDFEYLRLLVFHYSPLLSLLSSVVSH